MMRTVPNRRRSRTSCSILALATVLAVGGTPAAAADRSFQGTGVFTHGTGSISISTDTTSISITSPQAVINWTPTDNVFNAGVPIVFQPAGTTANFSGAGNYAVLNNIGVADFSRVVQLNGTIRTIVSGALTGTGSIYFYSPSGFLMGGGSVVNVGSLVLSALPISVDGSGNFIVGADRTVNFGPAASTSASITTNAGSQITATGPSNSYVAMVAPRVVHHGTINVNGSAALVAAEAATINFSPDGLFDIQVTTGSTSTSGVEVYGDIGGPTPTGSSDKQGIYLVAVPKNDAMTMLISNGADLGFTLANTAVDDNGAIILSAGHDISNGAIGTKSAGHGASAVGNFWFTGAHATSNLFAEATGTADLYSVLGSLTTTFDNDVTVHAGQYVRMGVSGIGTSLTVGGNLDLSADKTGTAGQSVTAGEASIYAWNGGTLSIAGSTSLSADGIGGDASAGTAGSGTGGLVAITANDGSTLTLSNLTTTSATGTGGDGLAAGVNAGSGTGGTLSISASNGGILNLNSPLLFDAQGYGGSASGAGLAGNGTGGVAQILAGNNAIMNFSGNVTLDADGFGGSHSSGTGGTGTGGGAQTDLLNNALLTINGNLLLSADGTGGNGGTGGIGDGGVANIGSDFGPSSGSTMTVSGNTFVNANGYGGSGNGAGGAGGYAQGGDAFVGDGAEANSYSFNGNLTVSANAMGGSSLSGQGGNAVGGVAALNSIGANFHVGNTAYILADGTGGNGASGGDGTGGFSRIRDRNIDIDGSAFLSASGYGGFGFDGDGGDGQGGSVQLRAENGTVDIGGSVFANADGNGGGSENPGSASGSGFGGTTNIQALSDGNLGIIGSLLASADGFGGGVFGFGTNGGNGEGGFVYLQAFGANAVLTLGGSADVTANGKAGELCGECGAGGIGGHGTGGQVTIQAFGANTASLAVAGSLTAEANGEGSDGVTGNGGEGEGGNVYLGANDGADLHVLGTLFAEAEGQGGYSYGPGDGGMGTGGEVTVAATTGGTLEIDGGGYIDADGYGGGAGIVSSGDGGDGFGGSAGIYADNGTVDIGVLLFASAQGHGGYSDNAAGGDGLGGLAEVFARNGGSINIDGMLSLTVDGFGGSGITGGTGTGGGDPVGEGGGTDGAHILARNGTISVTGSTDLSADGFGGSGASGGAGGDGSGGWSTILAANSNSGPSSITLAAVDISANATGGSGGQGLSGNQGGDGGAGGNASAGTVAVFANAGNGHLLATDVFANAIATGGQGGDGGNGDNLAGGNGGAGGNAEGGFAQVGTASGISEATGSNLGTATFASISADTSATGGNGGAGNFGTPDGNGGTGGVGDGGASLLLVRGSTVTVSGTTTLTSNGYGGDGGFGGGDFGTQGAGGDGFAGEIRVLSTSRNLIPAQQGTLNAGAINGSATGSGGLGSTNGSGIVEGGSLFSVDRSTVSIGSLDFDIFGDQVAPGADPSRISITNATVDVDTTFAFSTIGDLSFYIDNGSLTAGTINLSAGNFITDPDNPAPAALGTAFADNVLISTDDDFVADANWDVTNTFVVDAPGLIAIDSVHDDNGVDFSAGESISFVNIEAGTFVSLVAGTFIAGTDIDAGTNILAQTSSGDIGLEDLTAGGWIQLDAGDDINLAGDVNADGDINMTAVDSIDMNNATGGFFMAQFGGTFDAIDIISDTGLRLFGGGNITVDDLTAGLPVPEFGSKAIRIDTDGSVLVDSILSAGGIDITAVGSITGGNVTTGDGLFAEADGAIVFANISAGLVNPQPPSEPFSVALDSATSINVGNIAATLGIGFVTPGTLTAGNLTTDADVLAMVHGNMLIGNINADGRVFLADSSMFTNAGGTIGNNGDDGIDPEDIFAATPLATNGSITVATVLAGSFQAAPGTFFSSGDITTDGLLFIDAGTNITGNDFVAGDIFSPAAIDIVAGNNIALGDVTSGDSIALAAGGSVTTEDLYAYGSILVDAGGAVNLGNVTTAFPPLLFALGDGIGIQSHSLGPSVEIFSDTSVTTLAIDSAEDIIIGSGGAISTGNAAAAGFIDMQADGNLTTLDLVAGTDIELDTLGNLQFGTANAGLEFDFDASGTVNGGNVTAGEQIGGDAGGAVVLGHLAAGPAVPVDPDDFSVGIASGTSISVGNVSGAGHVGFATTGNLATGNVTAGDLFMTLVGGNIVTGSITTTAEGGEVYMADDSMFITGGGGGDNEDFDKDIVLALSPVATGGSITINGPVSTGLFRAAAGTGLTTQAINAADIQASAGGTATLNGIWSTTGSVMLSSNDIDITGTGGIDAEEFLTLISTNATQVQIGDGLPAGAVYALSNAEFGRISGYEVDIIGRGDASSPFDMLIGDLNVTGPLAGSNVEGSDLNFATGDIGEGSASGVIRVVGDVTATGFAANADQSVNFFTGRFELDAANGSISIYSSGSTLGGELGIYADRIHVAQGSILDQLAANPTYNGYQQDLNEAATVQRPEGVLRADTLWIESENLQDVLIQNTGTDGPGGSPAGFLVRELFVNDEVDTPPGSVNFIVNGQVVTEGGTLTGVAARDALVAPEDDVSGATANSTINSCPLKGECIIRPPQPPPVASVVDSQIDLITGAPLDDSNFGNEDSIDDNQEGDEGANNPISPPQPLFDTRPLLSGENVEDPVSGTGNPALLGSECEEDEQGQCPAQGDSQ